MTQENEYAGKFIGGREVISSHQDRQFVNFYFEDGSFDTAPIINGIVQTNFDKEGIVTVPFHSMEEVDEENIIQRDAAFIAPSGTEELPTTITTQDTGLVDMGKNVITEDQTPLAKYRLLSPIPYTDKEGNEIGKAEIGSIQEVPTELGDSWVTQGLAEKVAEETITNNSVTQN